MNLLLLFADDFFDEQTVHLRGRRLKHLLEIRGVDVGDTLLAGRADQDMGLATVTAIDTDLVCLSYTPTRISPAPLPVSLVIALPRPKMLKRILQTAATMGVKDIHFINSFKVEKSFWSSPWLTAEKIHENLVLGLEQAIDVSLPQVSLHKLFKPFVEDTLPGIIGTGRALLGQPDAAQVCPWQINAPATLVIGPEGGFIPYEVTKLIEAGCESVSLGERVLRVETAVPVLLARLYGL